VLQLQKKKLHGLGVRAQAWCISISPSFSVAGVSSFLSQNDEARRVEVQYMVSVRGALCLSSSLFEPLQDSFTVYTTNCDINQGYVGAMHCCKALLWVRRPDLVSLNLTLRFAHRLLLLL